MSNLYAKKNDFSGKITNLNIRDRRPMPPTLIIVSNSYSITKSTT